MKTALLFPGQGSQKVGMGADLRDQFAEARQIFEEADDALGYSISEICFEGPGHALMLTENTQPAILTKSIAALRAVQARADLGFDVVAGHSLGEWTALVAAGALKFADAVRLVHLRGKAMQQAVPVGQGAMAAILGLDADAVKAVCDEAAQGEVCAPANFNGGGQIVISGNAGAIERAVPLAKQQGAKRALTLPVSAPFHCELMAPAAEEVAEALAGIEISEPTVPVVANVDAQPNQDAARIAELLTRQVTGAVLWEQSVTNMAEAGLSRAIEVGPGAVLRGLVRRIASNVEVSNISSAEHVAQYQSE